MNDIRKMVDFFIVLFVLIVVVGVGYIFFVDTPAAQSQRLAESTLNDEAELGGWEVSDVEKWWKVDAGAREKLSPAQKAGGIEARVWTGLKFAVRCSENDAWEDAQVDFGMMTKTGGFGRLGGDWEIEEGFPKYTYDPERLPCMRGVNEK